MKETVAPQPSRAAAAAAKQILPVERLSGRGIVTTGRGKQISVEYHLSVTLNGLPASNVKAEGGLPGFSGQVWCPHDGSFVSVYQGKIMTLCIEDGRKLRFLHQGRDGAISVVEWLG